jgi:glycine cleavage system H protein
MDEFSYYNIFDTKGIEYIVVIAFLLLLIPFWLALNKQVKIKEHIRKAVGVLSAGILRIPQGVFYSRNHTWAYLEKSGIARIGLDDLLLRITGDVKLSHLKNPGDLINKGDKLAEIDQNGKSLTVFSPITGKILNSNTVLEVNPGVIHEDPYGKGWIYSIKPTNWVAEIPSFYLAEEATDWLKNELVRYKDFLAMNFRKYSTGTSMTILQDGGEIAENSLSDLPNELWENFQKEFLNPKERPG